MRIADIIRTSPEIPVAFLEHTDTVLAVVTDDNQRIIDCNGNLTRSLYTNQKPVGRPLSQILCPVDDSEKLSLTPSRIPNFLFPVILKICYTEAAYRCYAFEIAGGGMLLIGDQQGKTDNDILHSMSMLNNEMTSLSRELSKKNRELEAANRKITELMRTDPLTGLANRRYFQERYEEAFSLARRNDFPLSLILLDLDHFKQVNDTYGHDAGDRVLKTMGSILCELGRLEDLPARFGGEEFIVFLSHTDADGAMAFADRVRNTISHMDILENGYTVTASAGVARLETGDSKEGLIKRTDDALYRAKNLGRNRTEFLPKDNKTGGNNGKVKTS